LQFFNEFLCTFLCKEPIILRKYGPKYLNAEEFKECLKDIEQNYFYFLCTDTSKKLTKEFLRYHKKGHQTIGYRLNWLRLLKFIFIKLRNMALNPKRSVGKIKNLFMKK